LTSEFNSKVHQQSRINARSPMPSEPPKMCKANWWRSSSRVSLTWFLSILLNDPSWHRLHKTGFQSAARAMPPKCPHHRLYTQAAERNKCTMYGSSRCSVRGSNPIPFSVTYRIEPASHWGNGTLPTHCRRKSRRQTPAFDEQSVIDDRTLRIDP
jgi:hypothetical protein